MTVKLGKTPQPRTTENDPIGLLEDCHGRIRSFTLLAQRLVDVPDVDAPMLASAAADVLRYFTVALPLHIRDEDDFLAPALRARPLPVEVQTALATMQGEHVTIDHTLASLLPAWRTIARDGTRAAALAGALLGPTQALTRQMDAHLALEERVLFPYARAALAAPELRKLAREIRLSRR